MRDRRRYLRLSMTVTCLILLALPLNAQRKSRRELVEGELRLIEEQLREAAVRGDIAVLDYLLAEDYTNIYSSGEVRTKVDVLRDIESGNSRIESLDLDDIKITVYGDTAILTAKRTSKIRYKGQDTSGQFRQVRVFVKLNGRWQAVMLQTTRITQE